MKPLMLTMSAFGSYGGMTQIDFERAGNGLFLVTGDTGSGKTTIFDAISFALYGTPSGTGREGSMLRSQYAPETAETWVELVFEDKGQSYTIRRSPAYTRLSKRKNKNGEYTVASVAPKASLVMPDGRELSGRIREIDEKIREIVGVDREQFAQIAMIAQGEYIRLLHASSKERKEIFSRIFHTGIYGRIQQKLHDADKKLYVQLENNQVKCEEAICQVVIPAFDGEKASALSLEKWRELQERWRTSGPEVLDFLKELSEESRREEETAGAQEEALIRKAEAKKHRLELVKAQNQRIREREKAQEQYHLLEKQGAYWLKEEQRLRLHEAAWPLHGQEEELRTSRMELEQEKKKQIQWREEEMRLIGASEEVERNYQEAKAAYEEQRPKLEEAIRKMEEAAPLYAQCEQMRQEMGDWEKQKKNAAQTLQKSQRALEASHAEEEALRIQENEAMSAEAALAQCHTKREKLENLQSLWKELEDKYRREAAWKEELQTRQGALKDASLAYEAAERSYQDVSHRFLAMQAGILAETLTEGEPCPVCGSTNHPHPCHLEQEPVREEAVDEAKKVRDAADQRQREAAAECQEVRILLENGRTQCRELQEKLLSRETGEGMLFTSVSAASFESESGRTELLEKQLGSLEQAVRELKKEEAAYEKQIAKKSQIQARRMQNQDEQKKLETRMEAERERVQKAEIEIQTRNVKLAELEPRLTWKSRQELKQKLESSRQLLNKLAEDAEKTESCVQQNREKRRELAGRLASGEEHLHSQEMRWKTRREAFEAAIREHGFEDEKTFQEALLGEEEAEEIRNGQKDYRERLAKAQAVAEQLGKETEGLKEESEERICQEIADVQKEKEDGQKRHRDWLAVRAGNETAYRNLTVHLHEREKLDKEKQQINELYQTADGKVSGTARLDFQTYVQRQYFRQMIQAANRRLRRMTGGAFELQCRELEDLGKQGEVGLDLDVYSFVTDRVRDVKTLSGGESFMAALSMALGMADIIQSTAGSVRMDAMFIDEGFGSLDEESRVRAVQVLKELSGGKRLIGIISHVTELKEEMGHKLVVKKGNGGSQVHWEIED